MYSGSCHMKNAAKHKVSDTAWSWFFLLKKEEQKDLFSLTYHWNELVDSDSWGPMILKEKRRKSNRNKKPKESKFKTPSTSMLDYKRKY